MERPLRLTVLTGLLLGIVANTAMAQVNEAEEMNLFTSEPGLERRSPPTSGPVANMRPGTVGAVSYLRLSPDARRRFRAGRADTQRLRIALPDGEHVTCSLTPRPSSDDSDDMVVLSGTVASGSADDRCELVVQNGQVTGDIDIRAGRYRIMPVGSADTHAVVEIRSEGFPDERDPKVPPDQSNRDFQRKMRGGQPCDTRAGQGSSPTQAGPIRVMILYTPAARVGSPNIRADVELLMMELRDALSLGRTGGNFSVAVELAHAQEVNYREADDMGTDLDRITDQTDDYFNSIPPLRDRYRADLVHLIIEAKPGDSCGLGWLGPYADYAYSVSDRACAVNNYTFVHELGHNLGMNHDRSVVSGADPDQFNFGYVSLDGGFRSLMAYEDACRGRGKRCRRLLYFSSPHVRPNGFSIGRHFSDPDGAHNAEVLCRVADEVARFR